MRRHCSCIHLFRTPTRSMDHTTITLSDSYRLISTSAIDNQQFVCISSTLTSKMDKLTLQGLDFIQYRHNDREEHESLHTNKLELEKSWALECHQRRASPRCPSLMTLCLKFSASPPLAA